MPITYILVKRGQPGAAPADKQLYAQAKSTGETTVRDLAERISRTSTLSTVDVLAVLEAFFQTVPRELAAGRIVRFGEFGSFQTTLQGAGAATAPEFTPAHIHEVRVRFRPGKLFGQAMQAAELCRLDE
ncbi:HU family DNA-binding protein [Hymenobacter sp. B81]|uniref:HU family DNA-binding protein n=1 Tax=Hymenobacter sp. B81 TaxID=3344878 RepID=UPI0037DD2A42